jgi:hypothetical protein
MDSIYRGSAGLARLARGLALLACPAFSAGCMPEAEVEAPPAFRLELGGPGKEVGNSVRQTADGGYIVVGYTNSYGAGGEDVYLIRTDPAGDTLWTRTYGGPGSDNGWDVLETADGGFVVVGFTNSFGAGGDDIYMIATDAWGDTLWTRTFGGPGGELAWAMHRADDGGYVIAGQTNSYGSGDWDVFLVRTDAGGDTVWTRTLGGPGIDRVFATDRTSDGGSVFAGITTSKGPGEIAAYLVRTDSDGFLVWDRTYGDAGRDIGHGVNAVPDGGFLLVGYTNSFGHGENDIYLVRTDASGDVVWTGEIGGPGDDRAMMATGTPEGGYAIAGYSSEPGGYWDATVTRVTSEGEVVWIEKVAASPGADRGVMVQATSDGFVSTGWIWRVEDDAPDLFLVKFAGGV